MGFYTSYYILILILFNKSIPRLRLRFDQQTFKNSAIQNVMKLLWNGQFFINYFLLEIKCMTFIVHLVECTKEFGYIIFLNGNHMMCILLMCVVPSRCLFYNSSLRHNFH